MTNERPAGRLLALCLMASLLVLPAAAQEADFGLTFTDEADFLRQAGPEWQEVEPSVWQERRSDGSYLEVAFGTDGHRYVLERALENRETARAQLQELTEGSAAYFKKQEQLLAYEAEISFLRGEPNGDLSHLAAAGTSSFNDFACSNRFFLEATATAALRRTSGLAEASFGAPSPFTAYKKELFVSSVSRSNHGVDSDWDSLVIPSACCYLIRASSSITGGACSTISLAYFRISNGCNAFVAVSEFAECFEVTVEH